MKGTIIIVVGFILAVLVMVLAVARAPREPQAVCTTDANCARWEAAQDMPEEERCHGKPCR